ncbi:MAG: helix-hairpin-helix domain-containing protein [Lachnospiraceae bacterium]|nr:helix-hairpin-helix domain-containing protein [Lachnospiraceae bacterium]
MRKRLKQAYRVWQAGLAFALLLLLCGCTRKEELLLLSEETAEAVEDRPGFPGDTGKEAYPEKESGRTSENESREPEMVSGSDSLQENGAAQDGVIYVHVCGAVAHPGVYGLEAGSRVYEAVQRAGGFAESAEQNYVNQAQTLEDGVKLVIPTREEAAAAVEQETVSAAGKAQDGASEKIGIVQDGTSEGLGIVGGKSSGGQDKDTGGSPGGRININTASEAQLCEIPGVGATRAAAIAAYRESHGAFEKPEDIMKVTGIKEGMYEKIKDSISVN